MQKHNASDLRPQGLRTHLLWIFDRYHRQYGLTAATLPEFQAWQAKLRPLLADFIGLSRMTPAELKAEVVESVACDGYRRDKVFLQTEPEVWLPLYVLIPDDLSPEQRRPCLIAAHGHGTGGKLATAGRRDIPNIRANIDKARSDYGEKLVKRGYVVFCPDARGAGENREFALDGWDDPRLLESSCNDLNHVAISLGMTLIGMQTWDLMRLVDYVATLDYCDPAAVGCCGHSGGGLQTLWLAALDERIRSAVISGYFHGFRDTLLKTNRCGCNFVPKLWEVIDVGDLAALIAPRPLLIESGASDPLNGERGLEDVAEQLAITRQGYQLCRAEDRLLHQIFDDGHRWDGAKTYDFVARWLKPGAMS